MTKEEIDKCLKEHCDKKHPIIYSLRCATGWSKDEVFEFVESLLSEKESLIIELTNKVVEQEKEIERLKAGGHRGEIGKMTLQIERLKSALRDIVNWDDKMEEEWGDPGHRADQALKRYKYKRENPW